MLSEFIKITSSDGLIHHGLLFSPGEKTSKAIIHVHGLAGNFYENSFIPVMARAYTGRGKAFMPVNNRGHDYMSDIEKIDTARSRSVKGGGAYERFEECVFDISSSVSFLNERGISRICLQGHSTGCNKIVFYLNREPVKEAFSIALISPCDDIALMSSEKGNKFTEGLKRANSLCAQGLPGKLLEPELVFYPMSARTYLDYFTEGGAHDIFRYRDPKSPFPGLKDIQAPVFASYGTVGEYLAMKPEEALEILKTKFSSPDLLYGKTIPGASHNYAGKENELSGEILNWFEKTGF